MMLRNRRKAFCVVCGALIMAVFGFGLFSKDAKVSAKTTMYYGIWTNEENTFDASQWFSSGLYKRRVQGDPPIASQETMIRSKPLEITPEMDVKLAASATVALEYYYPEVDTQSLIMNPPALSQRVRYIYSSFAEPDMPVDYYELFLTVGEEQYVVQIGRNGLTGEMLPKLSAEKIEDGRTVHAEYRKIFKELDAAEQIRR